jgi:type IV pilus assembly protein PilV
MSGLMLLRQRGAGLIEVAISLLVLSIGALGLGSLQISAKRMGYEATQRTEAAALAMDLFERLRTNRLALLAYNTAGVGDASGAHLPQPTVDCGGSSCSPAQLTVWDLWQWERALEGATTGDSEGGLVRPVACVTVSGRSVSVEIAWQGFRSLGVSADGGSCGVGSYGSGDANRQWLQMTSWIAEE